jgi:hypothetical protein
VFAAVLAGWLFFQPPPPEYQAPGRALVEFSARATINAECQQLGVQADGAVQACARPGEIVLPNACDWPVRESYAELVCHELGHGVNRWRHDGAGNALAPNPAPLPPEPEMKGPEP